MQAFTQHEPSESCYLESIKRLCPQAKSGFQKSLILRVYKIVSISQVSQVKKTQLKENVQNWLIRLTSDPIIKILTKNSNLTKVQLETLLIDILAQNMSGKTLKYDEKARLRLIKAGVSRGSFNRTLKQARKNIIQAIYTILLLGYIGVFDSTNLSPYLEVSHKLKTYTDMYKDVFQGNKPTEEYLRIIKVLNDELETSLNALSNTNALSDKRDVTSHS